MRFYQKSETISWKENRFNFRKLPSKSRLSHFIIEIIADKDKRFSLNFTPKSIKSGEVMESEPQIFEPKTTYGPIDNSLKFAVV